MPKLSNMKPAAPKSAIKTRSKTPDAVTYEGGEAYSRKPKSELFLLAVSNMVGEDTFYEKSAERDKRFSGLITKIVKEDPDWIARFVPFLRNEMNMRSASIVMAVEYVVAGGPSGRTVINSAIVRADEPAEVLGYYRARYGRNVPQPIKRGVADAVRRLYTERNALKYDGDTRGYRMGDVIDIVHPEPKADWQSFLFRYVIDRRHNRPMPATGAFEGNLPTIFKHRQLLEIPVADRRAMLDRSDFSQILDEAGATWEFVSGWLQGPMDAKAWEAIIPSMGYMALLRNLRNFEEAKVSAEVMSKVYAKLSDPEEVAKSRQLPIRFYSAFKNTQGFGSKAVLEAAMQGTLQNVPALKGKTLILVDQSGSMKSPFSKNGKIQMADAAALFGAALALRAESADLYGYGTVYQQFKFTQATPVLKLTEDIAGYNGGGTNTFQTLDATFNGHDRVIILTDEQAFGYSPWYGARKSAREIEAAIYTFNLVGYKQGHLPSGEGNRYTFGGLTDAGFRMIDLIERGKNADWPF